MIDPDQVSLPSQIGDYHFLSTIGTGSFAIVKKAVNIKTNEQVACKVVPRSRLSSPELESRFETEIRVLQQMHHSYITQLYNLEKDKHNYYLFMELCPGGELLEYIANRGRLEEKEAKFLFHQVVSALAYLHSQNAVHRDLKLENILFYKPNHVKLTDFGFSRYVDQSGLVTTSCGTPCYASPECLSGNPYNGFKSDIWSIGVILYAMVCGNLPWTKRNQQQLYQQICSCQFKIPDHLSENAKDLILHLMVADPDSRLTIKEIFHHPWLQDYHKISNSFSANLANLTAKTQPTNLSLKKVDSIFQREASNPSFLTKSVDTLSSLQIGFKHTTRLLKMSSGNQTTESSDQAEKLPSLYAKVPNGQRQIIKPKVKKASQLTQSKPEYSKVKMKLNLSKSSNSHTLTFVNNHH